MHKSSHPHTEKVLNTWAVVLILWSIYRANFKTELPLWFDELIAKPIVFLLPVYIFISRVEKKDFFSSLWLNSKNLRQELLIGFLIGLGFFFSLGLGYVVRQNATFLSLFQAVLRVDTFYLLLISFGTSFSEEALSRGFVLKRLYESSKNIYHSSFFASLLFFFIHLPILFTSAKMSGFLLLQIMFIDLILSFAISLVFLERKNLTSPIIVHALYALSLYLFV